MSCDFVEFRVESGGVVAEFDQVCPTGRIALLRHRVLERLHKWIHRLFVGPNGDLKTLVGGANRSVVLRSLIDMVSGEDDQ